jgi:hypothetical protein
MQGYYFLDKMQINDIAVLSGLTKGQRAYVKKKAKSHNISVSIAMGADGVYRAIRTA